MLTYASGGGGGSGGTGDVVGPASSTDNAIARFDSTTGKLLQDSGVTVSDVAGAVVTIASVPGASPGTALVIDVPEPAGAAGASVAGKPLTLTASDAVASTDTAGAAAGGAVNITGGAAKRNTSGNANGGAVVATGGAGIGTGVQGVLQLNDVTVAGIAGGVNVISNATAATTMDLKPTNNLRIFPAGGAAGIAITLSTMSDATAATGRFNILHNAAASSTVPVFTFNGDTDTGIGRAGADQVSLIAGGVSGLTIQNGMFVWPGQSRVTSNQTNATTTYASTTLSVGVTNALLYNFHMVLYFADSTAVDGIKINFGGGSATVSAFRAHSKIFDAALITSLQTTALATDVTAATTTGDSLVEVVGSFTASSTGTFIPQFAQNAHSTGTATLYAGSHIRVWNTA
jgi:hypothetical protein